MEDSTGVKPRARSNSVRVLNFDEAGYMQKWGKEEGQVAARQQGRSFRRDAAYAVMSESYLKNNS